MLNKTSMQLVSKNTVCLQKCIEILLQPMPAHDLTDPVSSLDDAIGGAASFNDVLTHADDEFSLSSPVSSESSFKMQKFERDFMPCPPFSGARFSVTGSLVSHHALNSC